MEELLPYYERELAVLKRHAREFAEQYPKIAGRLLMSGEAVEDPHVERLIQSFALLASRVHKKLDDEYPQLTNALFQTLYPQYLRPYPSCSIARLAGATAQLTTPVKIARGTAMQSRPVKGIACKFHTAFDVTLLPVSIEEVVYATDWTPPGGTQIPNTATAMLTVGINGLADQLPLNQALQQPLRIFLDAEPSVVALLREALFQRCITVAVDTGFGPWKLIQKPLVQSVGFAADEALVEDDARSHSAYRLLTEYFIFPEKFNFIDLDLAPVVTTMPGGLRKLKLHFLLATARDDRRFDRLLDSLSTANFQLFCTPVVNLFKQHAEPIRLSHKQVQYTVLPDARRPQAFEVYAVERVAQVRENADGAVVHAFYPFYSLKHGTPTADGRYWQVIRDEHLIERSPGFEYQITVVDPDFNPAAEDVETLSIDLTCTNRDLPAQLPIAQAGGDLFAEGVAAVKSIQLLRKPTVPARFKHTGDGAWRLVSQLTLNHWSVSDDAGDGLRELLTLYDLARSSQNRRAIDGVVRVSSSACSARMAGNPFPTFIRGMEIRIAVRPDYFVGSGIWLFAELLSHVFGLAVNLNSFTRIVLEDAETGEVLRECLPRNGLRPIV
ncbi:type VI secretion system baseplate subunit TssF [Chitinimonas sp. BJB300]|uniref:type VI secretion system baseplate subunit TssF n=1 Tax=Chitinimonas sp. BJB300 TaxID=1559339 RepID=UPI000C0F29BA|nr:type VI secretion system baseplate subunit TssF [Chitinimonas sp. BJB300]PHV13178.1 type VI secretion system baseplate subunit TssF [Chitinimonas sp. BJB300]TSJ87160.1 type VI secretion system baseplate subunit TssF [Chitinimonas sp. BJB300]